MSSSNFYCRSSSDEHNEFKGKVEEQNLLQTSQDTQTVSSKPELNRKVDSSSSSSSRDGHGNAAQNRTAGESQTKSEKRDKTPPKLSNKTFTTASLEQNASGSSPSSFKHEKVNTASSDNEASNRTEEDAVQISLKEHSKNSSWGQKIKGKEVSGSSTDDKTSPNSSISSFKLITEKEISDIIVKEKQHSDKKRKSNQIVLPVTASKNNMQSSENNDEIQFTKVVQELPANQKNDSKDFPSTKGDATICNYSLKETSEQEKKPLKSLSKYQTEKPANASNVGEAYLSMKTDSLQNQSTKKDGSSSSSDDNDERNITVITIPNEISVESINQDQVQLDLKTKEMLLKDNHPEIEELHDNKKEKRDSSSPFFSSTSNSLASSKKEDLFPSKKQWTKKPGTENDSTLSLEHRKLEDNSESPSHSEAITVGKNVNIMANNNGQETNSFEDTIESRTFPTPGQIQLMEEKQNFESGVKYQQVSEKMEQFSSSSDSSSSEDHNVKTYENVAEENRCQSKTEEERNTNSALEHERRTLPQLISKHREDISFQSGWRKMVKLVDLVKARLVSEETVKKLENGEIQENDVAKDLRKYLEGDEPVAGLLLMETGEKMSFHDASKKRLLRRGTAISLLEAQAATGSIIDPYNGTKMSVEDAEKAGLIDKFLSSALTRAERAACGFKSKLFERPLSLFEAMKRNLIIESHGIRLLEAQIATGGIIDPLANHRITVDVAYERGLFDERLNKILENPEDDTKGFFDPNTNQNLTYLQLIERCVVDKETSLKLLPLYKEKQKKDYWK